MNQWLHNFFSLPNFPDEEQRHKAMIVLRVLGLTFIGAFIFGITASLFQLERDHPHCVGSCGVVGCALHRLLPAWKDSSAQLVGTQRLIVPGHFYDHSKPWRA